MTKLCDQGVLTCRQETTSTPLPYGFPKTQTTCDQCSSVDTSDSQFTTFILKCPEPLCCIQVGHPGNHMAGKKMMEKNGYMKMGEEFTSADAVASANTHNANPQNPCRYMCGAVGCNAGPLPFNNIHLRKCATPKCVLFAGHDQQMISPIKHRDEYGTKF